MNRTYRICLAFLALIALNILLLSSTEGASPNVTLKAVMSPEIRTIRIGEIPEVILTTRAEGHNLQFQWKLDGPGEFKGDDKTKPFIVYIPPDSIEGESEEVTIIVTVTDEKGQESEDRITFTLLALDTKITIPLPTPTPFPIHIRKVSLQEKDGGQQLIPPKYSVRPDGIVMITVDVLTPSNRNIKVEPDAVLGKAYWHQEEVIYYIAPSKTAESDTITLKVVDKETNKIIMQEVIHIRISDNSP